MVVTTTADTMLMINFELCVSAEQSTRETFQNYRTTNYRDVIHVYMIARTLDDFEYRYLWPVDDCCVAAARKHSIDKKRTSTISQ
jgi:hypothetical protein